MDIRTNVKIEIEALQQQISSLREKGPFLQNTRVERTPAGGTASKRAKDECKYARLRTGRGNLLDNGKKSKYIPVREINKYLAMCSRGKAISRLEKQLEKRQQKLARLNAVAASFGLS
ncbi:MAG: hypothetical protein WBC73_14895 [Phormidesmis sp.]